MRTSLVATVVVALLVAANNPVAAQPTDKAPAKKADAKNVEPAKSSPAGSPDFAGMYPQPTEQHKAMVAGEEGTWEATMKVFMPGMPEMSFKGTEVNKSILDGLWVESTMDSEFLGGKRFKGQGVFGYDVAKKKFVGVWVDNVNTALGTMEGDFDEKTMTLTMMYESTDPSGKPIKQKHTSTYKADGHKVFTIMMPNPAGGDQWIKMLEVESKRRSGEAKTSDGANKNGTTLEKK